MADVAAVAGLDPSALFALLAGGGAYGLGVHRAWSRAGRGRLVRRSEVRWFAIAWVLLAVALLPPMDTWAGRSLTGHMVQHVLLLVVVPPLLAMSALFPAVLWALPGRPRRAAHRVWRAALRSHAGSGWVAWALVTLLLQTAAMVAWHLPALYDAAGRSQALHALEHLSFLATSTAFWWSVGLGSRPRHGGAVPIVFLAATPGTALGAALTLSAGTWYRAYPNLPDQQLAGVVMWAFGGLVYIVAAAALFGRWLAHEERATPGRPVGARIGVAP